MIGDQLDDPLDPNPVSRQQTATFRQSDHEESSCTICIIYRSDHDNSSQESETTFSQGAPKKNAYCECSVLSYLLEQF